MFNQPYGGWPPQYPNQPVVFIPPSNTTPPSNPLDQIREWKHSLEELEKAFKKDEKKDDKKKPEPLSVPSVMLLMILLSPITGPIMSRFFQWGLASLPH